MRQLRILAVCDDPPAHGLATSAGHTLIAAEVLSRLAEVADVQLAYFALSPVPAAQLPVGHALHLPLQGTSPLRAQFPNAISTRMSPGARGAVGRASATADVTYLHGLGTFGLVDIVESPVVVNEIDPLSLFWTDRARGLAGRRRALMQLRAMRLRRVEQSAAGRAAAYLLVNPDDARELSASLGCHVTTVPNGVRIPTFPIAPRDREARIAFVGSLDYPPNIDSAVELCRAVLPAVREQLPAARVVIAGRRPVASVRALAGDGVEVIADPVDPLEVLTGSAVAVFPGGYGRGTRNSVLEAIRCGVPVVASTASARGIPRGVHLRIADDPSATAEAVVSVLTQGPLGPARRAARRAAVTLPDWDEATDQYLDVLAAAAGSKPRQLHSAAGGTS